MTEGPAQQEANQDGARWEEALEARTVTLPNATLDRALKFLEEQEGPTWGIYPDTDLDRHSSALAMAALRTAADTWVIADSTVFFQKKYADQIKGLGVDPLIDVIELIKGALPEDDELRREVTKRVRYHISRLLREDGMGTTGRLAELVIAASAADVIDSSESESAWKRLIDTQRKDGSWSAVADGGGVLTTTAAALRALNEASLDRGLGVRHDAYRFLAAEVEKRSASGENLDIFVTATVLLAVSNYDECDYWLTAKLEDWLVAEQNADGGWPDRQGSPSTNEHTALAVLALTAAGARLHVPKRLARAALEHAEGQLGDIGKERDRLQREFDTAVKDRCGGLVSENQALRSQLQDLFQAQERLQELEEQNARLRRVAEPVAYSSELLAESPISVRDNVILVTLFSFGVVALIAIVLAVLGVIAPRLSTAVVASFTAVAVLAVAVAISELSRRRNRRVLRQISTMAEQSHRQWDPFTSGPLDERLRAMRIEFVRMSEGYPPAIRQEMVFLLFDQFIEPPADVAGRLAEQAAVSVGLPMDNVWRFRRWIEAVALLDPTERRLLFDQIRRSIRL